MLVAETAYAHTLDNDDGLTNIIGQSGKDELGQEPVLDRILDLLLVSTLRNWLTGPGSEARGWYRARNDPVVGPALRLMHEAPAPPRGRWPRWPSESVR